VSVSGCFGKFSLTKKVYRWNDGISSNKFVKTIVMWALCVLPVYEIATSIDLILLNTIEVLTGKNPVAMNETDFDQKFYAVEGNTYEVVTTKNRYDIFDLQNPEKSIAFVFDEINESWSLHHNNQVYKITEGDDLFDLNGKRLSFNY
jgi:hypothetical protein